MKLMLLKIAFKIKNLVGDEQLGFTTPLIVDRGCDQQWYYRVCSDPKNRVWINDSLEDDERWFEIAETDGFMVEAVYDHVNQIYNQYHKQSA